jgi:hypothetical protein
MKNRIYILLGMHKSGTSLLSDILHRSGVSMYEENNKFSYDDGNKSERTETKKINHKLLTSNGMHSLKISPLTQISNEVENEIRILIQSLNKKGDWGFKDPRTCYTYSIWSKFLPDHYIIATYRKPEEVWSHYWHGMKLKRKILVFFNFFGAWCEHNKKLVDYLSKSKKKFILIDYSEFMTKPDGFVQLQQFVGRKLIDCREKSLYRSAYSKCIFFRFAKYVHLIKGGENPDFIFNQLKLIREKSSNGYHSI